MFDDSERVDTILKGKTVLQRTDRNVNNQGKECICENNNERNIEIDESNRELFAAFN
jgi:hypothetical protein